MARLPTLDDLGPRPSPHPVAAVAVGNTNHVAEATQELGRTLVVVGETIAKSRRHAEYSQAVTDATGALGEAEREAQRDPDFKTSPARFVERTKALEKSFADGIEDGEARRLFVEKFRHLSMQATLSHRQAAFKQESDYNRTKLDTGLEALARAAANAPNEVRRLEMLEQARMHIGEAEAGMWITRQEGAKFAQSFAERLDRAVVMRDTNTDPAATAERLKGDSKYATNLEPSVREQLQHTASVRAEHEGSQARLAARRKFIETQEGMIQKLATGKLTTSDILASDLPPVGEGSKEHFLNALRAQARENREQPFRTSPEAYRELYRRITLPDNDREKIVDAGPINEVFLSGKLKPHDRDNLLQAVTHDRTPEGNSLIKDIQTVKTAAHRVFMGHTMAAVSPELYGEASYRFGIELEHRANEYRKAGKDPRLLLTPGTPDYVLAPGRLNSYMPNARATVSGAAAKAGAPRIETPPTIADEATYQALPKGARYIDARTGKVMVKGEGLAK